MRHGAEGLIYVDERWEWAGRCNFPPGKMVPGGEQKFIVALVCSNVPLLGPPRGLSR